MPDYGFPKSARLLRPADFDRVFRRRCSLADEMIIVYACESTDDQALCQGARLGLVVSRKCGNAIVRNRWKRTLREAFRMTRHELPQQMDLVVIPRSRGTPDVCKLQTSLTGICWRLQGKLQASQTNRDQS